MGSSARYDLPRAANSPEPANVTGGEARDALVIRRGHVLTMDMYQGTRLACAEAINSGITTVHDWCHNVRGPAHADASLRALAESGLRARFSCGYAAGHANDRPMDLAGLVRLHRYWSSSGGLLSLGMAGETGSLTPGKRLTLSSWGPGARISACSPTPRTCW